YRFLGRVYRFATRNTPAEPRSGEADRKVLRKLHQTLRKITEDFETRWHFNTCIASIMELVNQLYAEEHYISADVMRPPGWRAAPQQPPRHRPPSGAARGPAASGDPGRGGEAGVGGQVNGKLR